MAKAELVRHQLFLPRPLSDRLEALAAKPGASKSSILALAVTAYLDRRGANELDERFAAHYGGADCRASALAAFNMAGSLGFAVGPLLSGALLSLFGRLLAAPHAAVFVVVGTLESGLAIAVYLLVRRGRFAPQAG